MMRYLGAYRGVFLLERDGQTFMQVNDGGWQERWCEVPIPAAQAARIRVKGRKEADMALVTTSENIPPGVRPIWETHPVEYLTWHRDNDPPPFSDRAATALAASGAANDPA